jgi:uncharacterized phage protein (TIGR01671 family)
MQNIDRFKFRGFYTGGMYEVFSFCNDFVKLVIDGEIQKVLRNEVVLMQATGLKDKNGKLIFEGDVVSAEPINTFDFPHTKGFKVGVCQYYYGRFGFKMPNVNGGFCDFFTLNNLEIIGNSFENPELLNNL